MRQLATLAVLLAATGLALPRPAAAASLSRTLDGATLTVDTPCARQVRIAPDPGLHGQAVVDATADNQQELDHLLLESRDGVRVHTYPGECWQAHRGDQPTLLLDIRVPAGADITLDEARAGRYDVGPVGGRLSAAVSGAGDVHAAQVTSLNIDLSGAGDIHVARTNGPARIELSGHGNVMVGEATMPSLSIELSGAGTVDISAGNIGKVSVEASGVGSTQIGADVGDARVDVSGVGSVRFAAIAGRLDKAVSGMGSVSVGR